MPERILVTGGSGFIGSNFIRLQLQQDPALQILNLDKLTYAGNLANLVDVQNAPNYTFIKEEFMRYLNQNTGTISCVDFATTGTAVFHVFQNR